jgi:hypothetical protein
VTVAALGVPSPQVVPVGVGEVPLREIGPRDIVAAVVGRQIDAVRLVVGGNDDAATIEDAAPAPRAATPLPRRRAA